MDLAKNLNKEIEKFKDHVIIVEGKKDALSLKSIEFKKVYTIHKTSKPIRQRIEEIVLKTNKKEKICLLTDLDKKGKELYKKIKPILQELGMTIEDSLRKLLIKSKLSHIEGIHSLIRKTENYL